jgi:hypothetical protein
MITITKSSNGPVSSTRRALAAQLLAGLSPRQVQHIFEVSLFVAVIDPRVSEDAARRIGVLAAAPFLWAPDPEQAVFDKNVLPLDIDSLPAPGEGQIALVVADAEGVEIFELRLALELEQAA